MTKTIELAPISTISKNAVMLSFYQLVCGLVQYSFFLILLRLIPKSHMDIYELGRSCLEIGVGVIGSSVAAVIVRENARDSRWWHTHAHMVRNLLLYATLALGLLIYVFIVLPSYSPRHSLIIGLFCITVYFQSRTDLFEAFFRSRDHVKFPVLNGVACNILITLLTWACVLFLPHPVIWAAGGVLLRWMIQGAILSFAIRREAPPASEAHETPRLSYRDILAHITPISVGAISFIIYARIDVLMLQWMGFEHTIAIYGCAFRPIGFLSMFVAAFYHAFAPTVSKMIHRDPRRAFRVSAKVGALFSLAGLAAALSIFLLRHEITRLLYPEIFESTADALGPLSWSLPIIFGGNAIGFFLVNQGKKGAGYYMIVNLIGVAVNILGNLLAIPSHQFVGAAWMTVATDAITTLLMIFSALLIIRQSPRESGASITST